MLRCSRPGHACRWRGHGTPVAPPKPKVAAKPALKLLDFYRSLLRGDGHPSASIELKKTKAASVTVRTLDPIGEDLMENWLTQWAF